MKSFDIFVDERIVESDLIVANLSVRSDVAVYYWLMLNSEIVHNIIAEKAMLPENGGIAINASAGSAAIKYEALDAPSAIIGANAAFGLLVPCVAEDGSIELHHELHETTNKIERLFQALQVGAGEGLELYPLKPVGKAESRIAVSVDASIIKNSIIDEVDKCGQVIMDATFGEPFSIYYESATGKVFMGASVQSLSRLIHTRLLQNDVHIGANVVELDLHRSIGRFIAQVAVGAEADYSLTFFDGGLSALGVDSDVAETPAKLIVVNPGVLFECEATVSLRYQRLLDDIDLLGSLADIGDMSLEDLYYVD